MPTCAYSGHYIYVLAYPGTFYDVVAYRQARGVVGRSRGYGGVSNEGCRPRVRGLEYTENELSPWVVLEEDVNCLSWLATRKPGKVSAVAVARLLAVSSFINSRVGRKVGVRVW